MSNLVDTTFTYLILTITLSTLFWRLSRVSKGNKAIPLFLIRSISLALFFGAAYVVSVEIFILGSTDQVFINLISSIFSPSKNYINDHFINLVLFSSLFSIMGSWLASALVARYIEPRLSSRYTKQADKTSGLTDIREFKLNKIKNYKPEKFFKKYLHKNSIFFACSENKAITLPLKRFKEHNAFATGYPGSGKTAFAQNISTQCIQNGIKYIAFDPKDDFWHQKVLMSKTHVRFIDVSEPIPQIDILSGLRKNQIADLIVEAFGIQQKGSESDVYSAEEKVEIASILNTIEKPDFELILDKFQSSNSSSRKTTALLKSINNLQVLNGRTTIKDLMTSNKYQAIYIKFSQNSDSEKLVARLIFLSMMFHRKNQSPKAQSEQHITFFLDEFKHLINRSTISALEMMRSHSCNFITAFQSINQFQDSFSDITGEAAFASIMNCSNIQIVYKQNSGEEARFWSDKTGKITYNDFSNEFDQNELSQEVFKPLGRKQVKQRNLVDENTFLTLPEGHAVFLGLGIAKVGLVEKQYVSFDTPLPKAIKSMKPFAQTSSNNLNKWEV